MTELSEMLEKLGLSQYLDVFVDEGFDSWQTVMDITESDLDALEVKLGHRRKLQRAIAESKNAFKDRIPRDLPQPQTEEEPHAGDESALSTRQHKRGASTTTSGQATTGAKRKYRRHPKPDEFAPERPPSSYVIFSNQTREKLRGRELSFTEIAKIVGERWQELTPAEKEPCEKQAQTLKEKYYADLAEYKKTPQYVQYQQYLAEFRAKHNNQASTDGGKRLKTEDTHSTRSNSRDFTQDGCGFKNTELHWTEDGPNQDHGSPTSPRTTDPNQVDGFVHSPGRSRPHKQLQQAYNQSPTLTAHNLNPSLRYGRIGENKAWTADNASSRHQTLPFHMPTYDHPKQESQDHSLSTSAFPLANPYDLHVRRTTSDSLPSLTPSLNREDTSLTSRSGQSSTGDIHSSSWPAPTYSLPPLESAKSSASRPLPVHPPLVTAGSVDSPSLPPTFPATTGPPQSRGHTSPAQPIQPPPHDTRAKTSLATLLRASEQVERDSHGSAPPPTLPGLGNRSILGSERP